MAALNLAGVSAVLNLVYAEAAANQINRSVVLANLLDVQEDSNATCTWRAKFSGRNTAGAKAEGFDAADGDYSTDSRLQASLAWPTYSSFAKVTGLAQALGRLNGGSGGPTTDLLVEEIGDAVDELAVVIGAHLYSGSVAASPPQIEGLARAVDSTGTYAGIAQSSYSEWASGEQTLATADLSLDNLRTKLHRPFKDACGLWPEFVMCSGTMFDAVGALFGSERRYVTEVTTQARGTVDLKLAGGFRAIDVDGVPYIEDRHCTASTFYALHSSSASLRYVPGEESQISAGDVIRLVKELTGTMLDVPSAEALLRSRSRRLVPTLVALSRTGDNVKVMAKVYCQLRMRWRNRGAKLTLT